MDIDSPKDGITIGFLGGGNDGKHPFCQCTCFAGKIMVPSHRGPCALGPWKYVKTKDHHRSIFDGKIEIFKISSQMVSTIMRKSPV